MTELTRSAGRTDGLSGRGAIAGLVVAAALIAGVVGGLIGARLVGGPAAQAVQAAPRTTAVDWVQYGRTWETQYRAMYPTTIDPTSAASRTDWQRRYEQRHPRADSKWVQYGAAWQLQYEQQQPRADSSTQGLKTRSRHTRA